MIILDTHIWIWWVQGDFRLPEKLADLIRENEDGVIGISSISCWEIEKLAEEGRLVLPCDTKQWIDLALSYPGIKRLELTPNIAIESTQLPGTFHRDPADQIIAATARVFNCSLLTTDERMLSYPHVDTP